MQSPFEIIYTAVTERCPQLSPKNTHVIHEWIAKGYDAQLDILPAIEQATKHGAATIHSFAYFIGFIRNVNEKRVKEALQPATLTQPQKDANKARLIEIRHRTGMYVPDSDWKWLEQYKERSGAIA